jgi:hypothetical protein
MPNVIKDMLKRLIAVEQYIENQKIAQEMRIRETINGIKDPDLPVQIDFYKDGFFQKSGYVPKGSSQEDREKEAKRLGIENFDEFKLDRGRVMCSMVKDGSAFMDSKGRVWISREYY